MKLKIKTESFEWIGDDRMCFLFSPSYSTIILPADSKTRREMRKLQEQQISQEGRELHARSWLDAAPDEELPTRPIERRSRRVRLTVGIPG
jgi:hypothetical protein